jgi:hypothetical protein
MAQTVVETPAEEPVRGHQRAFHRLAVLHNPADLIISGDAGIDVEPGR